MMNTISRFLVVALFGATSACGVEITAGGAREGEVEAVVTTSDDARGSSDAPAPLFSSTTPSQNGTGAGRIEVDAVVTLITDRGTEVRLSRNPVTGVIRIEGTDSASIGADRVVARRYSRVRVTFTRVDAVVLSGLPVLGTVSVDLGLGRPLAVEAPIDLEVRGSSQHTLVVDLNAHSWLPTADPVTRLISRNAFQSAVEIRMR